MLLALLVNLVGQEGDTLYVTIRCELILNFAEPQHSRCFPMWLMAEGEEET